MKSEISITTGDSNNVLYVPDYTFRKYAVKHVYDFYGELRVLNKFLYFADFLHKTTRLLPINHLLSLSS